MTSPRIAERPTILSASPWPDYSLIDSGEYAPGARIPGENEIMTAFEVSRDTAWKALQVLRDQCVGGYIADLIQNLAMLDPILGGIDR